MSGPNPYLGEVHDKRQKKRIYFFSMGGFLALDLLLFVSIWFFINSPFFHVQSIVVHGTEAVPEGDVLDLLRAKVLGKNLTNNLLGFNNLLIWPKELATADLALLPTVEKIDIAK